MSTMEAYTAEKQAYLKVFAANVRRLREAHDPPWSQTDLYDAAKLHRTEIGRIEAGETEPRVMALHALANALGVTLDALIEGLPVPKERKPSPQKKSGPPKGQ
jgi:transcriptional regulator with XRE-family HTH domain